MENKKQYTVRDLRKWLKDNGHQEGYDDIGKMIKNKEYAEKTDYKMMCLDFDSQIYLSINEVLSWLFKWTYSNLGFDYWREIKSKILSEEKK